MMCPAIIIQWKASNLDTIGPEESLLIREVSLFQGLKVFGEEESVLFREVALFQGCPYKGVPPYCIIHMYMYMLYIGKSHYPANYATELYL